MKPKSKVITILAMVLGLIWATGAGAQLTVLNSNVPAGFEVLGYIQNATVFDSLNPNSGGYLTMNGTTMIVPDNTVIQMPANTLKWADLFDPAVYTPFYDSTLPAPPNLVIPPGTSGLALSDNAAQALGTSPYLPFNAFVQGNIDVKGTLGYGAGAFIVGLIVPINQDLGNGGPGFITYIDYAKGRFEVNGTLNVQNTGTVLEINDPVGRFGWAHSPDPRWSADTENPTITAGNGYPMCVAKFAPPAIDPDCPSYNRQLNPAATLNGRPNPAHDPFLQTGAPLMAFTMPAKPNSAPNPPGVTTPDPWKPAPLMLGDYVSFAGVLCKNDPGAAIDPLIPWNQQTYYSVNTIGIDKLAIYTAPGTVATAGPAYVQLFKTKIGNGGAPVNVPANPALGILGGTIPLPEPRANIDIRGWVTDSTQLVDIYAVDVSAGGIVSNRLLATVLPEAGFTAGKGNKGRFRFDPGKGNFLPATRNYKAVSRHGQVQLRSQSGITGGIPLAGLKTGAYTAPNFIVQFPDAPPGFPNIPNNFNIIPFLSVGEGNNLSAGPLLPFPPFTP